MCFIVVRIYYLNVHLDSNFSLYSQVGMVSAVQKQLLAMMPTILAISKKCFETTLLGTFTGLIIIAVIK